MSSVASAAGSARWRRVPVAPGGGGDGAPSRRRCHSATVVPASRGGERMFVLGGGNGEVSALSDFWSLELATRAAFAASGLAASRLAAFVASRRSSTHKLAVAPKTSLSSSPFSI